MLDGEEKDVESTDLYSLERRVDGGDGRDANKRSGVLIETMFDAMIPKMASLIGGKDDDK